jgi:dolichyl-phosphate-mannose-protein mannosyltransferase
MAWSLIGFTVLTRLPLITYPKACDDEQVYVVVAIEMLRGGRPYVDGVERKPPALFYLYQLILGLFGERNYVALHLAALVWTLATMWLLYRVMRRIGGPGAGWVAAGLYALYSAWANFTDLAFNGELLMNLPVVAAFAIAMRESSSRWRLDLFAAGALITTAFLLKQPSVIAGVPLAIYLLHPDYRRTRGLTWAHSLLHAGLLALGFAAALGGAALYLDHIGILREAWYWTIGNHVNPLGPTTWFFWHKLPARGALFVLECLPVLLATAISLRDGVARSGVWGRYRAEFAAFAVFLIVSWLGVNANGQFNYHYFIQLMPPLALLAAPIFAEIWQGTRVERGRLAPLFTPVFLARWIGLTALVFLVVDAIGLAQYRGPLESAVYVRDHSTETDRIFMWGQGTAQTGFYLDAQRRPATRYIASFPLNGMIFGLRDPDYDTRDHIVPGAWENLKSDFERHPPKFIIDCHELRDGRLHRIRDYPYLKSLLDSQFHEVFRAPDGIVYERRSAGG